MRRGQRRGKTRLGFVLVVIGGEEGDLLRSQSVEAKSSVGLLLRTRLRQLAILKNNEAMVKQNDGRVEDADHN